MKHSLVVCTMAAATPFLTSSAWAGGLAVDVGTGYRSWTRGDVTLSRSYVQVVPSYTTGRWRLAAPVQLAFRGAEGPFSFGNPLAFKSDDWVNLDVEVGYSQGDTRVTYQHDSLQLLSSGRLPASGYGDVETENRLLVHRAVAQVGGSRLNALGGLWSVDRWTETTHGQCRGPVLGVGLEPQTTSGWAPTGLLLLGHEGSGSFGTAVVGVRYRRSSWQVEATLEARRFGGDDQPLFARTERRWNLALTKALR